MALLNVVGSAARAAFRPLEVAVIGAPKAVGSRGLAAVGAVLATLLAGSVARAQGAPGGASPAPGTPPPPAEDSGHSGWLYVILALGAIGIALGARSAWKASGQGPGAGAILLGLGGAGLVAGADGLFRG